mmetsp:Transcript_12424/g.52234  ORF Transcript_12424/g.52234 Transcript_12424/m.52234 type:complete len:408 (-) Transcript_12424:11206-12429(-)
MPIHDTRAREHSGARGAFTTALAATGGGCRSLGAAFHCVLNGDGIDYLNQPTLRTQRRHIVAVHLEPPPCGARRAAQCDIHRAQKLLHARVEPQVLTRLDDAPVLELVRAAQSHHDRQLLRAEDTRVGRRSKHLHALRRRACDSIPRRAMQTWHMHKRVAKRARPACWVRAASVGKGYPPALLELSARVRRQVGRQGREPARPRAEVQGAAISLVSLLQLSNAEPGFAHVLCELRRVLDDRARPQPSAVFAKYFVEPCKLGGVLVRPPQRACATLPTRVTSVAARRQRRPVKELHTGLAPERRGLRSSLRRVGRQLALNRLDVSFPPDMWRAAIGKRRAQPLQRGACALADGRPERRSAGRGLGAAFERSARGTHRPEESLRKRTRHHVQRDARGARVVLCTTREAR